MRMTLLRHFQKYPVTVYLGVAFFIGMMAVGYYYNLTFIQLGLVDLGQSKLQLAQVEISAQMALLAVLTSVIAVGFGVYMSRRGMQFRVKLRLAWGVVSVQTVLTMLASQISSELALTVWIVVCSLALGLGVPVTFGMAVDLVPVHVRGRVAALITGTAYFAANLLPASWSLEEFTRPLLWIMPLGVVGLGVLSFIPVPLVQHWSKQHRMDGFGMGRYLGSATFRLWPLIILMFGVFFVDSLGFLRLIEVPRFMQAAWQSVSMGPRLFIGLTHVLMALIGGVLYDALDVRQLFYWIFGIFALTHLMYSLSVRAGTAAAPLAMPMLYATAVSLYTVVNFALWADLSSPRTIARNVAIGVAVSGWTATFISTALAIIWASQGMPLERHLNIVDSLAMLFFLILIILAWWPKRVGKVEGEAG